MSRVVLTASLEYYLEYINKCQLKMETFFNLFCKYLVLELNPLLCYLQSKFGKMILDYYADYGQIFLMRGCYLQ